MLEEHKLTSPELTGDWEHKLGDIEHGKGDRVGVHDRTSRSSRTRPSSGSPRWTRRSSAPSGSSSARARAAAPRPARSSGRTRKAYGCTSWKSREEPGCGFVIWKRVASRTLTPEVARQLIEEGRTREVLSGFRSQRQANLFGRGSS